MQKLLKQLHQEPYKLDITTQPIHKQLTFLQERVNCRRAMMTQRKKIIDHIYVTDIKNICVRIFKSLFDCYFNYQIKNIFPYFYLMLSFLPFLFLLQNNA